MSEEPIRLRNAQREIRDAYVAAESGLFTLNCVPGAGKSVVAHHIAAEDLLCRYVDGDRTPEQRVAVLSFNRDEADEILPKICARLRTIVEHELVPAAENVSEAELEALLQRVRRAPYVDTIDGFLRGIFRDIHGELGFDGMPSVGNDAVLRQVHADCYDRLRSDPETAGALDELEAAYPDGEHDDSVAEMLAAAVDYCRDRRLSAAAFGDELEATRDAVYASGRPDGFDDIADAVERFAGGEADPDFPESVDDGDREELLTADRALYDAWGDRIEEFRTVLDAYHEAYRDAIREYGVVSHTDVAALVADYFEGSGADDGRRERVRERYRARIESVVVDEAQDLSAIQHAALSQIISPEMRVFACGDVRQGIYLWRHADPTLFESATENGEYLGVEWEPHENRTATTTYRCRPAVAAAIDAVAEPVFSDPERGAMGDLDPDYPSLDADRDGRDEPAVHVAAFSGVGRPGSEMWANPDEGNGEANQLATLISRGLADGTFTDADGEPLGVTVLFRRGARMAEYEAAFAAEGLRVRTESERLFACSAVRAVFAVCEWLVEPGSPERTRTLLTDLGLASLEDAFESHGWQVDAVPDDELTEGQAELLDRLSRLRDRRDAVETEPAGIYLEGIAETLALRADPHGLAADVDPPQRVANLDALVETVSQWTDGDHHAPRELLELVAPYRADPAEGPTQPSASGATEDVTFRTVHSAKGDEDDVVVVADPAFDIWSQGPHAQRLVTQGPIAGLAPPTNVDLPTEIALGPFAGGLYDPEGWGRDTGLRWASGRWRDSATGGGLVGPERLRRVAANERAESWRLLYVALSRARDHLVVPLPETVPSDSLRDRWMDSIRDGLAYSDGCSSSYTLAGGDQSIEIAVNDVDLFAARAAARSSRLESAVTATPPRPERLPPWVPRFLNPSTMYPLTEDPERFVLPHLLGESLHTETNDVPDDLPLSFDRLGPEAVGTCLHDVLTELVRREVSEESLRTVDEAVREVFDETVSRLAPGIDADEREGLFVFFRSVLSAFLDSELWVRISDPDTTVTVEQPIDGILTVDGVEFEIHGQADFVVAHPNGRRYVADAKIALAEPVETTRRRYELQTATYASLFERAGQSTESVEWAVETFGVTRETVTSSWGPDVVEHRLATLLDE